MVYPNAVDHDLKQKWLDRLEAEMRIELEGHIPKGTEVIGVHPYDDIYVEYLKMKIAERNGDIERFNNYFSLFQDRKDKLYAHYVRTYPKTHKAGWKNVL